MLMQHLCIYSSAVSVLWCQSHFSCDGGEDVGCCEQQLFELFPIFLMFFILYPLFLYISYVMIFPQHFYVVQGGILGPFIFCFLICPHKRASAHSNG